MNPLGARPTGTGWPTRRSGGARTRGARMTMPRPVLPRPYPHAHLDAWTDEQWRTIPATGVPIHNLIPSQSGVGLAELARLVNGGEPQGGDGWTGRAVYHRGRLYLHDGHTRWTIRVIRGDAIFFVRIVEVGPNG